MKKKLKSKVCKELEALLKEKYELLKNKDNIKDEKEHMEKVKSIDSQISSHLLLKQREAFEDELASIKELKHSKGNSAAVFSVRDRVVGSKSSRQEATVITDPKTKAEVTEPEEIKRVSLQYCVDLLSNRRPKEEFKEDVWLKDVIHCSRMK